MLEYGARYDQDNYFSTVIDKDNVSATTKGILDGEPVEFSGGSSNIITGSFTTGASGNESIEHSYTGEGYPVYGLIYLDDPDSWMMSEGMIEPTGLFAFAKSKPADEPTYTGSGYNNLAMIATYVRNNGSNSSNGDFAGVYSDSAPGNYKAGFLRIDSSNKINYHIQSSDGSGNYGLRKETKYNYIIAFSE